MRQDQAEQTPGFERLRPYVSADVWWGSTCMNIVAMSNDWTKLERRI